LHGVGLSLRLDRSLLCRMHLGKLARLIAASNLRSCRNTLVLGAAWGGRTSTIFFRTAFHREPRCVHSAHTTTLRSIARAEIAVENVSAYVEFDDSTMAEWEFVAESSSERAASSCSTSTNVYVNSVNHGFDPTATWSRCPRMRCAEIHLAGFEATERAGLNRHSRRARRSGSSGAVPQDDCERIVPRPTLYRMGRARHPRLCRPRSRGRDAAAILADCHAVGCVRSSSTLSADILAGGTSGPAFHPRKSGAGASERMAVYSRTIRSNYRNAMSATYPAVRRDQSGTSLHSHARRSDAMSHAHPSRSGISNEYGDAIRHFLHRTGARRLAYLPDVARLEWRSTRPIAPRTSRLRRCVSRALSQVPRTHCPRMRHRNRTVVPAHRFRISAVRIWRDGAGPYEATACDFTTGHTICAPARNDAGVRKTRCTGIWSSDPMPAISMALCQLREEQRWPSALSKRVDADSAFDLSGGVAEVHRRRLDSDQLGRALPARRRRQVVEPLADARSHSARSLGHCARATKPGNYPYRPGAFRDANTARQPPNASLSIRDSLRLHARSPGTSTKLPSR
jgi:hypothetical protein